MEGCAVGPVSQCPVTSSWSYASVAWLVAETPRQLEHGAAALGLRMEWKHVSPRMQFFKLTREKALQAERMGARPVSQGEAERMAFAVVSAANGTSPLFGG